MPKSHPSAKNRFLYYAGKIHLLPSSILKALQIFLLDRGHPLSKGKIPSTVFRSLFKKRQESPKGQRWTDESIESFLTRRLGKNNSNSLPLLDYVGSAVLHGIYAADASKLSVRSIFGFLWNANLVHGNPARAILPTFLNTQYTPLNKLADGEGDANAKLELIKEERLEKETTDFKARLGAEYVKEMDSISVISFPNGVQTLTDAILAECKQRGVQVQLGSKVESILVSNDTVEVRQPKKSQSCSFAFVTDSCIVPLCQIKTPSGRDTFDRVVLAQPSSSLEATLKGATLPNLVHNPSSTVAVLNLAMPPSLAIQVPPGFGYLVPRACAKEGDNSMGLLGVVFDSVAVPGQDGCSKMTMMFGGPFWKQGYKVYDILSLQDKEDIFIDQALSLLAKHLFLDEMALKSEVVYKRVTLQRDCIVTYSPGHLGRMDEMDQALQKQPRLTVIGASYTGVSLNDCVLYATRTANRLIQSELDETYHGSVTGLEELVRE